LKVVISTFHGMDITTTKYVHREFMCGMLKENIQMGCRSRRWEMWRCCTKRHKGTKAQRRKGKRDTRRMEEGRTTHDAWKNEARCTIPGIFTPQPPQGGASSEILKKPVERRAFFCDLPPLYRLDGINLENYSNIFNFPPALAGGVPRSGTGWLIPLRDGLFYVVCRKGEIPSEFS